MVGQHLLNQKAYLIDFRKISLLSKLLEREYPASCKKECKYPVTCDLIR